MLTSIGPNVLRALLSMNEASSRPPKRLCRTRSRCFRSCRRLCLLIQTNLSRQSVSAWRPSHCQHVYTRLLSEKKGAIYFTYQSAWRGIMADLMSFDTADWRWVLVSYRTVVKSEICRGSMIRGVSKSDVYC
jgi:hypothetical protein